MFRNVRFSDYFNNRRGRCIFLLDTDILIDIAKNGPSKTTYDFLHNKAAFVFAYPSIMELGFGTGDCVDIEEINMAMKMYVSSIDKPYHTMGLSTDIKINYNRFLGTMVGVSPHPNEWFASKNILIRYMEDRRTLPYNAKKMQVDALLFCIAWNLNGFIWTNNVKDFATIAYFLAKMYSTNNDRNMIAERLAPVFSTDMLRKILAGKPVNIYREMMNQVKSEDVRRVLNAAIIQTEF